MDKCSRTTVFFLLLCIAVNFHFQPAGSQNVAQNQPEKPFITKVVMDTISLLKESHKNSWEKIKTVIHDLQMQFSPPNLYFRNTGEADSGHDGVKGTTKDAVGKSFDKAKETIKESAESAAIHKAAEKVKDSGSEEESDAEL